MVYLHVPFCRSFCTYCDFYSELCGRGASFKAYADAVCGEIAGRKDEIRSSRETDTLYVGGGTPSVLPPDVLERIVGEIVSPTLAGKAQAPRAIASKAARSSKFTRNPSFTNR